MSKDGLILNAVGDVCLGDSLISLGFGMRSMIEAHGPGFIFDAVRAILTNGDVLFGNLECVLSDRGLDRRDPQSLYLRGAPEGVETCVNAGFDVMNVANNHTLQYGAEAFHDTVHLLRAHGIAPLGIASRGEYQSEPVVLERNGISIGFLGYSHEWEQYFQGKPLYAATQREGILADVARLRRSTQYVVVSIHWGLEYMTYPSRSMTSLGRTLIDHGCDVVLGHHPHVVQGCEHYRHGIIAYSLGNFVFDKTWWHTCLRTLVLRINFARDRRIGVSYELIPVRITRNYQPAQVEGRTATRERVAHARLAGAVNRDSGPSWLSYGRLQKLRLLVLTAFKALHILVNIHRYEPHVRRHLIVKKVLRRGSGRAIASEHLEMRH